jgi:hypothetical protein
MAVSPCWRNGMNGGTHVRYALALGWLLAPIASASAGELGPISRASVSLSITVPPHVSIRPSSERQGKESMQLCIGATGLRYYRVAALDLESVRSTEVRPSSSASCVPAAITAPADGPDSARGGPVTLLIVPD